MKTSKIEWTESTWNPVTGCTKISAGCKNCYAERMAKRLQAMGQKNYNNGFTVTTHENVLGYPLKKKKPQNIFVNSMSDIFHEDIPYEFIDKIFFVMNKAHWHRFQVLTKRPERLYELSDKLEWTPNIWMGVTVENYNTKHRIEYLKKTPAVIKFISFEPLISDIGHIDLSDIDWAIVGGESGPGSRLIKEEWVLRLKEQCKNSNTPFFFKQWGGVNKKKTGRVLDGKIWDEMPLLNTSKAKQLVFA